MSEPWIPRVVVRRVGFMWAIAVAFHLTGCERGEPKNVSQPPTVAPNQSKPPLPKAVLVFPLEIRADDAEVNTFVLRVLQLTIGRDYQAFRLLWAADETPFPQEQFEIGFKSVTKISVDVLQKMRDPRDDAISYAFHALVELDPERISLDQEPTRDIVLVVRREHGLWRLAHAPKRVREVIRDMVESKAAAVEAPTRKRATAGDP